MTTARLALAVNELLGKRKPTRLRKPPLIVYPRLIERAYYAQIAKLVAPMRALVDREFLPQLRGLLVRRDAVRSDDDDYGSVIERVINGLRLQYSKTTTTAEINAAVQRSATETSTFNRTQVNRQVKTVLGIDVMQSEPWLATESRQFVRDNVKLITSIPDRYFSEVERLAVDGVKRGRRWEDLSRDIAERYDVSQSRANLIARDQIGKFNSELTTRRHQDLGLERYRWRTSLDERVRSSHREREGRIYYYDRPPEDGAPGYPIQCRCTAEPVFSDLLNDD